MKHVVIIGAGFGGLACAKSLMHLHRDGQVHITLIDKNNYHSIHGSLYEVATLPKELTDLSELKKTVAIPLEEIFLDEQIDLVKDEVVHINPDKQLVETKTKMISYDYLVVAQGAQANFFGIPGAEQFSMALQTPQDALRLRNQIELVITNETYQTSKPIINIIIAGGGVSGIELAAELQGMVSFLSWQNNIPERKVQTVIIERAATILPGFDSEVIKIAEQRLTDLNVRISNNSTITEVTDQQVKIEGGGSLNYGILVWTAGVQSCQLNTNQLFKTGRGGRIEVDEYFGLQGFSNLFLIGDQCCYYDSDGKPTPGTAAQAIDHGQDVAKVLHSLLHNQLPPKHQCKTFPFTITLGGKWAIFQGRRFNFKGVLAYWLREFIWFKYLVSILGFSRGLHWLIRSQEIYSRND